MTKSGKTLWQKEKLHVLCNFFFLSLCFQKAVCCRGVRKRLYEGRGYKKENDDAIGHRTLVSRSVRGLFSHSITEDHVQQICCRYLWKHQNDWLIDWLINWGLTPFLTISQLYHGGQFTYSCISLFSHTSTPHNNTSKRKYEKSL